MKLSQINFAPNSGYYQAPGPLGTFSSDFKSNFYKVISSSIGIISVVAFLWFTFQFLVASVEWISSGGDKGKVAAAKEKITHSIIGLLLVVAATFLAQLMGSILGIDILKPLEFIDNIW